MAVSDDLQALNLKHFQPTLTSVHGTTRPEDTDLGLFPERLLLWFQSYHTLKGQYAVLAFHETHF